MNQLYYGDCLQIMQEMEANSVDLIYLDPPFNSNRNYNQIYKDSTGRPLPEQIEAFCDTWELDHTTEQIVSRMPVFMREAGLEASAAELWKFWARGLRETQPRLLAYLAYMTERLIVMRKLMKPSASIYLHCDPTASHYLKVMLDTVFGYASFKNEIVWHYRRWSNVSNNFQKMHDIILFYGKTNRSLFNIHYQPYSDDKYIENTVRGLVDGKLVRLKDKSGNYIKRTHKKKGVPFHDVWHDINFIAPTSKERLGYPTQKPVALLKRIIEASSNENDIILDPFCGCATTIAAAHILNRRWIGIDIAYRAIDGVVRKRLLEQYGLVEGKNYEINGIPRTLDAARDLWRRDKYQFQRWIVETIEGFVSKKRSGDKGIDGEIYFRLPGQPELESMIIEVKGGAHVGIHAVRDLRGTLERCGASLAGLIVMDTLGEVKRRNFIQEMTAAGSVELLGKNYARMQLLSVSEIVEGKRFDTPAVVGRSKQGAFGLS